MSLLGFNPLFYLLKSTFIFQDILSYIKTLIPPILDHNLSKYDALKKAFYLTGLEKLDGDYSEFGVFTGSAFVCAMRCHRRLKSLGPVSTDFYGFDSFSGFGDIEKDDQHDFYTNETFSINKDKVLRFIKKRSKGLHYKIVEGYFEKTLFERTCLDDGIKKSRIVFIDCDLKRPTQLALDYMLPSFQEGMVLILDDFFSYKGSETKGVTGALNSFQERNPHIHLRQLFDYGMGGRAYIVSKINS
jgi:O-methyltransferase